MSSLNRFLSASAASWARILLTIVTQVLLVPIFLGHWSVEQYGCWLIIQTIVGVSSILSYSHQTYAGYEFLKVADAETDRMPLLFYSAVPYVLLVALFELLVLLRAHISRIDRRRFRSQSLPWIRVCCTILVGSGGLLRGVSDQQRRRRPWRPSGGPDMDIFHECSGGEPFSRSWSQVTSGVAVVLGANVLQTVLCIVAASLLTNILIYRDLWLMHAPPRSASHRARLGPGLQECHALRSRSP